MLAGGYVGLPATCNVLLETTMAVDAAGAAHGSHTDTLDANEMVTEIFLRTLRTALTPEGIAALDTTFMQCKTLPQWVDSAAVFPPLAELLANLRFVHWKSPCLRFILLRIKKALATPKVSLYPLQVQAAVAACFPEMIDRLLGGVLGTHRDGVPESERLVELLIGVCSRSYASCVYTVLRLVAARGVEKTSQRASTVLHRVQEALLASRGAQHIHAVFPLAPRTVTAALETHPSLFPADAERIRRARDASEPPQKRARYNPWEREVCSNTVLMQKICSKVGRDAVAGEYSENDIYGDEGEGTSPGEWVRVLSSVSAYLQNGAEAPYVVEICMHLQQVSHYTDEAHTGDVVLAFIPSLRRAVQSCGVAATVALHGYCALLEVVFAHIADDAFHRVVKVVLRAVLEIVAVRGVLASCPVVAETLWGVVVSTSEGDMPEGPQDDCCAAYWLAAAAAPSPLPYVSRVHSAVSTDTPRVNRRSLHMCMALCLNHLRPPYSRVLLTQLQGILSSQPMVEALRTSLPSLGVYAKGEGGGGGVYTAAEFRAILKTVFKIGV